MIFQLPLVLLGTIALPLVYSTPIKNAIPGVKIALSRPAIIDQEGFVDYKSLLGHFGYIASKYNFTSLRSPQDVSRRVVPASEPLIFAPTLPGQFTGKFLWKGNINIGSSNQAFSVLFDTGVGDTVIPDQSCSVATCGTRNRLNPALGGIVNQNRRFSVPFGGPMLAIQGNVYAGDLTVAGITAHGQVFGGGDTYPANLLNDLPADGILGMPAMATFTDMAATPFFHNIMTQLPLLKAQSMFSFKYTQAGGSELYLGGANANQYTGTFSYANVVASIMGIINPGYWAVNVDSVTFNNQPAVSRVAIIDTGAVGIFGDPATVNSWYATIPGLKPAPAGIWNGYQAWTVPCASIPNLVITIAGRAIAIPSQIFNLGQVSSQPGQCLGGLIGMANGNAQTPWVIGDVMLQNVYTVFDFNPADDQGNNKAPRVGFATLR